MGRWFRALTVPTATTKLFGTGLDGIETTDNATTGGDNKLDVFIASYKPDVRCSSASGPPWQSCVSISSNMRADKTRKTFGHVPDARVKVRLPYTYEAGVVFCFLIFASCLFCPADGRCTVTIDITGEPTGLSWYEAWEGVVALAAICVRGKQKSGKATGLGLYDGEEV